MTNPEIPSDPESNRPASTAPRRGSAPRFSGLLSVASGLRLERRGRGPRPVHHRRRSSLDGTGSIPLWRSSSPSPPPRRWCDRRSPRPPGAGRDGLLDAHGFTDLAMSLLLRRGRAARSRRRRLVLLTGPDPDPHRPRRGRRQVASHRRLCGTFPHVPRLRRIAAAGGGTAGRAEAHFRGSPPPRPRHARAPISAWPGRPSPGGTGRRPANGGPSASSTRRRARPARTLLAQVHERLGVEPPPRPYRQAAEGRDDQPGPTLSCSRRSTPTGLRRRRVRARILLEQGHVAESIAVGRQAVEEYPDAAWRRGLGEPCSGRATSPDRRTPCRTRSASSRSPSRPILPRPAAHSVARTTRRRLTVVPQGGRGQAGLCQGLPCPGSLPGATRGFDGGDRGSAPGDELGQPDLIDARTLLGERPPGGGRRTRPLEQAAGLKMKPNDPKATRLLKQWCRPTDPHRSVR